MHVWLDLVWTQDEEIFIQPQKPTFTTMMGRANCTPVKFSIQLCKDSTSVHILSAKNTDRHVWLHRKSSGAILDRREVRWRSNRATESHACFSHTQTCP